MRLGKAPPRSRFPPGTLAERLRRIVKVGGSWRERRQSLSLLAKRAADVAREGADAHGWAAWLRMTTTQEPTDIQ